MRNSFIMRDYNKQNWQLTKTHRLMQFFFIYEINESLEAYVFI